MAKELERITGSESLRRYLDTDYLGACNFDDGAEPIVTIGNFYRGDLTLGGGRKENHVVIKFREKQVAGIDELKPLILNATNLKVLKKLYGGDSPDVLENKQIQLYIDPKVRDPQDGGYTNGIRIRPFPPKIKADEPIKCDECKGVLAPFGRMSAIQLAEYTRQNYKKVLCADCAAKAKAAKDAQAAASDVLGAAVNTADASEQTEQEVIHENN